MTKSQEIGNLHATLAAAFAAEVASPTRAECYSAERELASLEASIASEGATPVLVARWLELDAYLATADACGPVEVETASELTPRDAWDFGVAPQGTITELEQALAEALADCQEHIRELEGARKGAKALCEAAKSGKLGRRVSFKDTWAEAKAKMSEAGKELRKARSFAKSVEFAIAKAEREQAADDAQDVSTVAALGFEAYTPDSQVDPDWHLPSIRPTLSRDDTAEMKVKAAHPRARAWERKRRAEAIEQFIAGAKAATATDSRGREGTHYTGKRVYMSTLAKADTRARAAEARDKRADTGRAQLETAIAALRR